MADKRTNIILRFGIVYSLLVIAFVLVVAQIVVIQTTERDNWLALQKKGEKSGIVIEPKRGNIYAADGRLLASSIPTYRIYMDMRTPALHSEIPASKSKNANSNPSKKTLFEENIDSVAICLSNLFKDRSVAEYKSALTNAYKDEKSRFPIYPKRIPYYQLKELKSSPLYRLGRYKSGLIEEEYIHRVKPFGSLASRTIGDVYALDSLGGRSGLEQYYDKVLTGKPGLSTRQKVANTWQEIVEMEPVDGMDIVTTIDIDIQDISESALLENLKKYSAKSGYVIMMETKTGEVKSIVNMYRNDSGNYYEKENGAVSDMMEPGSTFKIASLMVALEDEKTQLTDSIQTGNGVYNFGKRVMRDHNHHKGGYGKLSVEEVIHASSNVGISRIIHENYKDNPAEFVDGLYRTKISEPMNIDILGAANAKIYHPKDRPHMSLAWTSIGYETSMPPIYTLRFYNAIANGGEMINPIFVKGVYKDGRPVKIYKTETVNKSICKSSTLKDVQQALLGVVEAPKGTAKSSVYSEHVRIAGKTGTAQISQGNDGYKTDGVARYVVSFCGYFPADNPEYTMIVVIRDPRYAYISSGEISGTVFKKIAERTMALKSDTQVKKLTSDSIYMENIKFLPEIKHGDYKALQTVMKNVKLDMSGESDKWVKATVSENETKIEPIAFVANKIPDVRGMGAKDAVYLLEKEGLRVQLSGRGRVTKQNIAAGNVMELTLN